MSGVQLVQQIAATFGRHVSGEAAECILWEFTSYPFVPGKADAERYIGRQVAQYFVGLPSAIQYYGEMGEAPE